MKLSASIYGPSAKHEDHELKWKNSVGQLTEQTEKTKLVACLLYFLEIELSGKAHHKVKQSVP